MYSVVNRFLSISFQFDFFFTKKDLISKLKELQETDTQLDERKYQIAEKGNERDPTVAYLTK